MENIENKNITLHKYPFLCSIIIFLIYHILITVLSLVVTVTGSFITGNYENFESNLKTLSPLTILICFTSIILLNLFFKNLKIYKKGNFFKTLKASSFYLTFITLNLIYTIYIAIKNNAQFKPISGIFFGIFVLIFGIGFIEESLYRGLILNIFAKKYLYEPNGILKILFFPAIIFGSIHILNILIGVSLEKAILQTVLAFLVGILLNAIYLRGGNIFVLILIHVIVDASGLFNYLFLETNITISDSINNMQYTPLFLAPLYLLLTFFLLRKSKLKEIKKTLEEINK